MRAAGGMMEGTNMELFGVQQNFLGGRHPFPEWKCYYKKIVRSHIGV
jgi:hypothetical protein